MCFFILLASNHYNLQIYTFFVSFYSESKNKTAVCSTFWWPTNWPSIWSLINLGGRYRNRAAKGWERRLALRQREAQCFLWPANFLNHFSYHSKRWWQKKLGTVPQSQTEAARRSFLLSIVTTRISWNRYTQRMEMYSNKKKNKKLINWPVTKLNKINNKNFLIQLILNA